MPQTSLPSFQDLKPLLQAATIILALIFWIVRTGWLLIGSLLARPIQPGIYLGVWVVPKNLRLNPDLLRLRRALGGFKAYPLYVHKRLHDYRLRAFPLWVNKNLFRAYWYRRRLIDVRQGPALFHHDPAAALLTGVWAGATKDLEILTGPWSMQRIADDESEYFRSPLSRIAISIWEHGGIPPSMIERIVTRHSDPSAPVIDTPLGLTLAVRHNCFIPSYGKVAEALAKYAADQLVKDAHVLDLGTGSGFLAIHLAKEGAQRALGVDIDDVLRDQAISNAATNKVTNRTAFRTTHKRDLFAAIGKDETFDLIVANLPFTRAIRTLRGRKSLTSPYRFSFRGSPRLLEQLVLGSGYHCRPGSKLIFAWGDSGYTSYLHALISVSAWAHCVQVPVPPKDLGKTPDDTFSIMHLELRPELQTLFSQYK